MVLEFDLIRGPVNFFAICTSLIQILYVFNIQPKFISFPISSILRKETKR